MPKSIVVLAVPHQLQGPNFHGYIDDPSYSKLLKDLIADGVDFVFEEAAGRGPSTVENLANSILGAEHYLDFDPTSGERGKFGIAAQTGGGYPIDLFQRVEPGVYADTVEFSILAEQQKREKLWAKRVVEQPFTKGIAICGLAHGLSFSFELERAGLDVGDARTYIPYHKFCNRAHVKWPAASDPARTLLDT